MQKDSLVRIFNPELKYVVFDGFKYPSIQVF